MGVVNYSMHRSFLIWATVLGGLAVMLGAFGAHGLKALVPPESVEAFRTGVTYQMYHVLALLSISLIYRDLSPPALVWAGVMFIIGIFLFSGSLYLLTFLKIQGVTSLLWLGIVTPIGGVFFIAGWASFLYAVIKR